MIVNHRTKDHFPTSPTKCTCGQLIADVGQRQCTPCRMAEIDHPERIGNAKVVDAWAKVYVGDHVAYAGPIWQSPSSDGRYRFCLYNNSRVRVMWCNALSAYTSLDHVKVG